MKDSGARRFSQPFPPPGVKGTSFIPEKGIRDYTEITVVRKSQNNVSGNHFPHHIACKNRADPRLSVKKRPEPVIVSFIIKEHAFLPKNPSFPFILFIVSGQAAARFLTGSTSRFGHENLKNKETEIALILAKKNKVK